MSLEKGTEEPKPSGRSYFDGCAAAHALDLVGERWALLVIRELMFGPKRFSDLRASLPRISANVLTQRLAGLEAAAILRRRKLPPPAAAQVYELTEWGYEAEEIFQVMGRWAARSPSLAPAPMSVTSALMSMTTMLDPERARGLDLTVGFCFGQEELVGTLRDGALAVERGPSAGCDLVFGGDQNLLVAVLYGGLPLDQAVASGGLSVQGDPALIETYLQLFPLPSRAPGRDALD